MRRPARKRAISSKNDSEMSKKNVKRGRKSSGSMPRATQSSAFCSAVAKVNAIASAGVAPACCMCWPTTDIGFHCGTCRLQNSMWSRRIRRARGQREAEEHVVGDVVARGSRSGSTCRAIAVPAHAAPLGGREQEREQRERRRVVHRARHPAEVDAREAGVHVVDGVDDHAAGAEQLGVAPRPCRSRGTPSCRG